MSVCMRRLRPPDFTSRGFTLLEVLVALAVFSISLVVVMEVFSANLRNLFVAENQVYAATRAEYLMREVLSSERLTEGPITGTTDDGYRYEILVTKIFQERYRPTSIDLLQITLKLSWVEGSRRRSVDLISYRMQERKL